MTVRPGRVGRVFAVRMKKAWVLSYPLSAQRKLIRLGGCPGWSESSLGAHSFCWFCHVVAHKCFTGIFLFIAPEFLKLLWNNKKKHEIYWELVTRRQHSKKPELQFFRKSLFKLSDLLWHFPTFCENTGPSSLSESCDFAAVSAFCHLDLRYPKYSTNKMPNYNKIAGKRPELPLEFHQFG